MLKQTLATILLAASLCAAEIQGGAKTGTAARSSVAWARSTIGASEITVELPGKSEQTPVALEQSVRSQYEVLETQKAEIPGFSVFVSYAVSKQQKAISLDGAARGALDRVKDLASAPDYKETITNTTVVGMPGRKIQCSFTSGDKKLFLTGMIFAKESRMWQVICTGEATAANTALSQRVLQSVKRATGSDGS